MTSQESIFYKKVGEKLRRIRKTLGISQEKLAYRVGMQSNSVHRYEAAQQQMSLLTATNLAKALDIPLGALIPDEATFCENQDQNAIEKEARFLFHKLSAEHQLFVLRILKAISD